MKRTITILALLAVAEPAASQTMLDRFIGKLTKRPGGQSGPVGSGRNLASITPAQTAEIDRLLTQPVQDARIVADRRDAAPLIRTIVATAACARDELAWNALNRQTLEPKNWQADGGVASYAPMRRLRYHDAGACLDATRMTEWTKPALNALSFRVFYVAADSGEAANQEYLLQKGSEGQWLLRNVGLVIQ